MVLSVQELQIPLSFTVGTTAITISDEKNTTPRSVLTLTNTSTLNQVITIGFNSNAVAGVGIVLYPGQSWIESPSEGFRPTNVRISAVANAAGGTLAAYERSA